MSSSEIHDEVKLDQIAFTFDNKEVNLTPQLSGNKLDLLKFYKRVIKLGGFDYINEHKLWAQLAEPLNLPKTCTSRSYMLKQAYIKTLKDFEFEFKGKIPASSSELEGIKSEVVHLNTPLRQESLRSHRTPGDSTYTPSGLSNSIQANIPGAGASLIGQNTINLSQQTKNFAPIPPGTQPIQHQALLIRIYYSLKSNLKNEMEWGLIQLLKFSYFTNLGQMVTGKAFTEEGEGEGSQFEFNGNGNGDEDGDLTMESIEFNNNDRSLHPTSTSLNLVKLDPSESEELQIYWLVLRNLLENPQLSEYLCERQIFKDCLNYTLYYCFNSKDSSSSQIQELKLNCLDCLVELSSFIELEEDSGLFGIINGLLSNCYDRGIILKSLQILNNWMKIDQNLDIIENQLDLQTLFQFSWLFETDKNLGLLSIDLILNYFKSNPNLLLTPGYEQFNLQLSQLAYRLLDTHIFVQNQETNSLAIDTDSIILGWELIELFLDNSQLLNNLSNLKSKLLVKSLLQLSILPPNIQFKFLNYINKV
ncbi:hypothetical protein CONCODRAFT_3139 [Conidiobolus coronatus NRRL 28638]|uniref:ARID domain-containing protein n=1 Tax=Conidiobolus coronatus (strain ATCC 28846 / CBS 209.66 / NRRL 28638) TaxID=796925 RepID=A0A137PFX8_CONC2|nr:hypothetical protein CONCODRAFT_3139 [Conidiobolus coronatus NRRL 28638]|eukprot:KXN73898.1 hypothetical protein CONCODRAFT_3139 [Conidiobolus coronatus NRRL 28638]